MSRADFTDPATQEWLIEFFGGKKSTPRRRLVLDGRTADLIDYRGEILTRAEFLERLRDFRDELEEARRRWAAAANARGREDRERQAFYAMQSLRAYLADVVVDVAAAGDGVPLWPDRMRPPDRVTRARTREGELALDVLDELQRARESGICPQCGHAWFDELAYRRRFCSDEHAEQWKQAHRRSEDPERAKRRAQQWRDRRREVQKRDKKRTR